MKKYSYGLLFLLTLFIKNINVYANVNMQDQKIFELTTNSAFVTSLAYHLREILKKVLDNAIAGKYFNFLFGGIAICIFLLFTLEIINYKSAYNKK